MQTRPPWRGAPSVQIRPGAHRLESDGNLHHENQLIVWIVEKAKKVPIIGEKPSQGVA